MKITIPEGMNSMEKAIIDEQVTQLNAINNYQIEDNLDVTDLNGNHIIY